jgi:L-cystine uptake protein TcyP (sodium:dicarboxylate symporter family)
MKISIRILNWIFLAFAIAIPTLTIFISVTKGVGQGIQFILLPPIVIFFLILFWWTKNLLKFITICKTQISSKERMIIGLQVLWMLFMVLFPMVIITAFGIWNRYDRNNPLVNIATQCYTFLMATGLISVIIGIILSLYYSIPPLNHILFS